MLHENLCCFPTTIYVDWLVYCREYNKQTYNLQICRPQTLLANILLVLWHFYTLLLIKLLYPQTTDVIVESGNLACMSLGNKNKVQNPVICKILITFWQDQNDLLKLLLLNIKGNFVILLTSRVDILSNGNKNQAQWLNHDVNFRLTYQLSWPLWKVHRVDLWLSSYVLYLTGTLPYIAKPGMEEHDQQWCQHFQPLVWLSRQTLNLSKTLCKH